MAESLVALLRSWLSDQAAFKASVDYPVLLWQGTSQTGAAGNDVSATVVGITAARPRSGETLVYRVKNSPDKSAPFVLGITLGRGRRNDLLIDDESISRFHAYFRHDVKVNRWFMTDAESKHGTFINEGKVKPSEPTELAADTKIRFGNVETRFLLPERFFAELNALAKSGRAGA